MPYITLEDIKKSLPEEVIIQLTDDARTGTVDQAIVDSAIARADSAIDSHCASLYDVPFASAPQLLKDISTDIAIFNLYSRKADLAPGIRQDRYRNAIKTLEKIAAGMLTLEPSGTPSEGPEINSYDIERTFTPEKLENY